MNDYLADVLSRVAARDPSVAPELRRIAARLNVLADELSHPTRDVGGASDRVRMRVVGSDGTLKQDTGGN